MKKSLALVALALALSTAQAQPPAPVAPSQPPTPQPVPVKIVEAIPAAEESESQRAHLIATWIATWSALLAAMVAVSQAVFFYWQLKGMTRSIQIAESTAQAAMASAEAVKLSERAYVTISHEVFAPDPQGNCRLKLQVKNHGKTPADVTNLVICRGVIPQNDRPPQTPDYMESRVAVVRNVAFLVAGADFQYNSTFVIPEWQALQSGASKMILYGYVEYTDKFETRHRGGWAREYSVGSGLTFVLLEGYNYDRVAPNI